VEDYYTTREAARVLRVTEARVRQMLGSGELKGGSRDSTTQNWRIPKHEVHARLEKRRPAESSRVNADAREWIERVTELERELGRIEGRLELTEQTRSTLREAYEREKERADEAELEARRLRGMLEEARKPERPWWRRVFGG
jgi:excisionase family DNA binding protein